ncbi:iron complex transport system substrate-binding protein [Methylobacillus rhizosphaerae]|uniref:Iron complex transport system substrate-binding protein n=2 Tax=Methylobacillus rhizosphaerae TaxID=551994 RepID=A0A238YWX5_9PROT|nr:iron complex transport system substrate-binding protein [Methylobacillus rhizosphaerae]
MNDAHGMDQLMQTLWSRLAGGLLLALSMTSLYSQAAMQEITDLAGRKMPLPAKSDRILLGEGRTLPALAILDGQTLGRRIVGMPRDFEQLDPAGYTQYVQRFPELDKVAHTGRTTAESFSVEKAIALKPDVAVFGLEGHGPTPDNKEILAQLTAAGITVVFIDFRKDPLRNTARSMEVLGQVMHAPERAAAFVAEYRSQLARVEQKLAGFHGRKPSVFLENRVGLSEECCATMSHGLMGLMLEAGGGSNIAADLIPGEFGTLSLEYLMSHPPDLYIGTAIGSMQTLARMPMRIALGAGVDAKTARASLKHTLQRQGIASLPAVQQGRAYAIWHHFYSSPFNVVAVQVFAKWLHPELFQDMEPRQTLSMLYERFLPVPLDGEYWVALTPDQ